MRPYRHPGKPRPTATARAGAGGIAAGSGHEGEIVVPSAGRSSDSVLQWQKVAELAEIVLQTMTKRRRSY